MRKEYKTYTEIPPTIQEYLLTVAEKKHIMDIPLEEINGFLAGLNEFYNTKTETHEEGWV